MILNMGQVKSSLLELQQSSTVKHSQAWYKQDLELRSPELHGVLHKDYVMGPVCRLRFKAPSKRYRAEEPPPFIKGFWKGAEVGVQLGCLTKSG